jgi:folylpolyglutamate synthase/dihydropteroate synthase
MKDKNYIACLRKLEMLDAKIILTKPDYKRAEEPEVFYKYTNEKDKFFISENIKSAFMNAKKLAGKQDLILITGSFFLVSDLLKNYNFKNII